MVSILSERCCTLLNLVVPCCTLLYLVLSHYTLLYLIVPCFILLYLSRDSRHFAGQRIDYSVVLTLNSKGPQVTALGFGAMGLSAFYGKPESDEERFRVLDRAYELGETFWDSADVYMDSEDLIGKWFKRTGKREDIFMATKFGSQTSDGKIMGRSDPEYAREACEKSLKRLGIPTIDLYYCHRLDGKTPIEKTVEAMAQLKK